MNIEHTNTDRGFPLITFKDAYNKSCSLQISSVADYDAVWLGIDDPDPMVLASRAGRVGINTTQTTGWIPYPINTEVSITTRMHLNGEQVEMLIGQLQNWLENREFKKD